ncbi:MAG: GH3 auxin-responsive promoter family protein [Bacteroidales bacterium]|nr:GH3 auxin-responsive promoter family protein [Bacteroidales bacterium]
MEKLTKPIVPNFLLGVAGGLQYRNFARSAKNPRKCQEKTLREILAIAQNTEYGRVHHFKDILKAQDDVALYKLYQQNVQPNDYEDLRPFVERHKNGESNILFPGKPALYATTSGTTKEPKWIPITQRYLRDVYGKMNLAWLYTMIRNRRKVFAGKLVSIVGKVIEGYAPDGTICGSISGFSQRDCPQWMKDLSPYPFTIYEIEDYTARYYSIMRFGIEHNTTLIITANPSTIVEMQNNVNEYFDQYVEDIEKGTLNASMNVPDRIRESFKPFMKPNPERAAELRALKAKYGTVLPKHYWPDFQLLTTWKCGNTKVYLDKFKDSFPAQTFHQEFSYYATECRFGLVVDDTSNTVLCPHMHYYEFVAEEDMDKPDNDKRFWQLHELQTGKRYITYVTTYAGLYRYNMNDLIEVGPRYWNTPSVFLVQKVNGIVTMTGEKLHERQFIEAVRAAEKELQMPLHFFIGFADLDLSAYRFYYEFENLETTQEQAEIFTQRVDELLKEYNQEYKSKRDSLRVKDPVSHRLQHNSFETFKAQCIAEGKRDGQFKLNLLLQDEGRHEKFKKLVLEN